MEKILEDSATCHTCGEHEKEQEDWVQCDRCNEWYHFQCAGVNEDVANRSWYCNSCDHNSRQNKSNEHSAESTEEQRKSQTSTPAKNAPALPRDVQLNKEKAPSTSSTQQTINFGTNTRPQTCINRSIPIDNSITAPERANVNLMLARLEEEREAHQRYLERKYAILSETADSNEVTSNAFCFQNINMPSYAQIAVRQSIPKDLPTFSGDPEEWPAFYSSYESSTKIAALSDVENMLRLQKCLKGKAKEVVKDKLIMPSMVPQVIATLKTFFGRPEYIIEQMLGKIRKAPSPKDRLDAIIDYALHVRNVCATMEACQLEAHLNNPMLLKELVDKLPNQHKLNWAMHTRDESVPVIKSFSDWLYKIAEAAASVIYPTSSKSGVVNTHTRDEMAGQCSVCKASGHKAAQCEDFKGKSLDDRWNIVKSKNLCRQCLKGHKGRCFSKKECGTEGCTVKHHPLLHRAQNTNKSAGANEENAERAELVSTHNSNSQSEYFRIIPVRIYNKEKSIKVFAFLDEGSSVTLIEQHVIDKLELSGTKDPICLRWTGETTRTEDTSVRVSFQISAIGNELKYWLNNVHTVSNLALPQQTVDVEHLKTKYRHFCNLPMHSYDNAQPVLLIGVNNWKVAIPTKVKEGGWNEPIASKCRLGWTVQGSHRESNHGYLHVHTCQCKLEELHEAVKNTFILETPAPKQMISDEEDRAAQIMDNSCIKVDGKYEVELLWRSDEVNLPESFDMALRRANCLNRKTKINPPLRQEIQAQIDNLLTKGYAHKLRKEEECSSERVWYLPIFAVKNPNKPKRVRLVWDAAAKANGVSLNDFLLTGPDLLRPLINILMSFRIGQVAICGDIAEMFHRINIASRDGQAQRFLWFDKEEAKNPSVYVMRAMSFGLCCAPYIAHYVRNKNAQCYSQSHPRAVEAITLAHYVDDFIDSVDTEPEAFQLATDVGTIHAAAGFHLRNWSSNSINLLKSLHRNSDDGQAPVDLGNTEKVLGMYWDPNKDNFKYIFRFVRLKRNIFSNDVMPTKREILQTLMSIFDPLGFLSAHTISLKILLQKVWRAGVNWDDELPPNLQPEWYQWSATLEAMKDIDIPRCYATCLQDATDVELHTFVDASEEAYAAVCYLRTKIHSTINVSIVIAKSRVAPLRPVSIPRLELQAALMGSRLAQTVLQTRRLKINKRVFWSDSKTVLRWLRMDPRNFQQFVMYRVGEILETTEAIQWRWIPSNLNVADMATKRQHHVDVKTWLSGPGFLKEDEKHWPTCDDLIQADHSETRKHLLHVSKQHVDLLNYKYFSNWRRLYRAVANVILYIAKLKATRQRSSKPSEVSFEYIQRAKNLLIQDVQKTAYAGELNALSKNKPIDRRSQLLKLNIYVDEHGILRAQGREGQICARDVIVLPREHAVTSLLVRHYHESSHHISHEATINLIRGCYYIPRLRVLYKTIRTTCQRCKIDSAKPQVPQMAPLPHARLASFERPFSYIGVDYFGPIYVVVGRHREKRWGVVYTCLTLRAIHIEVAHSLDTNSCVMCLRNFIARRGTPLEIFSDNGTNFKATEKIIRDELKTVDFMEIQAKHESIKWRFNPPGAPHMGGAWERLVRSIKTVFNRMCATEKFSDESLKNAFCEIEFIINARPLTHVSLEAGDDQALTPNHLLLGSADGLKTFNNQEADLRSRWRQTQLFADRFWKRWVKEYAPTLTKRSKWFVKCPPIRVGDIVIVVDETLPRNCWPKGRVVETVVAKDGQVRRATILTKNGLMVRPTAKLAIIDVGVQEASLHVTLACGGENVAAAYGRP